MCEILMYLVELGYTVEAESKAMKEFFDRFNSLMR